MGEVGVCTGAVTVDGVVLDRESEPPPPPQAESKLTKAGASHFLGHPLSLTAINLLPLIVGISRLPRSETPNKSSFDKRGADLSSRVALTQQWLNPLNPA